MLLAELNQRMVRQGGRIVIAASVALLVFAMLVLAASLGGDDQAEVDRQAEVALSDLEDDLTTERADLRSKHADLLDDISGVDHDRVSRDSGMSRSLVLSLTGTSASTASSDQSVAAVTTRYPFLDGDSQVVQDFLPEWLSSTTSESGDGRTYRLAQIETQLIERSNRDYTYLTVARMNPVSPTRDAEPEDAGRPELVTLAMTTSEDGTVTDVEAHRVSSRSRNELIKKRSASDAGSTQPDSPTTTSDQTRSQ